MRIDVKKLPPPAALKEQPVIITRRPSGSTTALPGEGNCQPWLAHVEGHSQSVTSGSRWGQGL